jgi:hypothetical protein
MRCAGEGGDARFGGICFWAERRRQVSRVGAGRVAAGFYDVRRDRCGLLVRCPFCGFAPRFVAA